MGISYIQRGILQALNPLSKYMAFIAIVPGAYPGEAKMCKKCAKMANFWTYGLNYWETVEDRGVHAAMRLISIEYSFHPCVMWYLPRLSQGRTQGRPTCALDSLEVAKGKVAKFCLRLIAETDARSVGDSHPSCLALMLGWHVESINVGISIQSVK